MDVKFVKFILEYAITDDFESAIEKSGYSRSKGAIDICNIEVIEMIRLRRIELAKAVKITSESILAEWYDVAIADPLQAMQIRRVNCRHCHGIDNGYQYTKNEYSVACERAMLKSNPMPDMAGGIDFNPWRTPNAECTECGGYGEERVFVESIENIPANVRKSITSIESRGAGHVKINFRDKDKAIENMAKYLAMFVEHKHVSGNLGITSTAAEDMSDAELIGVINDTAT